MLKLLNRTLPLVSFLVVGCAWNGTVREPGQAQWLAEAQQADSSRRQSLWATLDTASDDSEQQLRSAWLMALPGHEGHDPRAASQRLRALSQGTEDPVVRAMIDGRAELLEDVVECRVKSTKLQQRLDRIIEIEQNLQSDE